jgi:hypothetical protein
VAITVALLIAANAAEERSRMSGWTEAGFAYLGLSAFRVPYRRASRASISRASGASWS